MKKIGLVVLLTATCRLFAADGTWTGAGSDGIWTNAANWADGIMPSGGGLAIFNGTDSGRTILPDGISGTFGGVRVTAGTYEIARNAPYTDIVGAGSGFLFDIAPGGVLTNKMKLNANNKKVTLTGGGDYAHAGEWLGGCTGIDVLQGTFWVVPGVTGDGLGLGTNRITVASGARLNFRSVNSLANEAELYVEAGGLIDFGGQSDVIGGVSGAGTIINTPDLTFTLAKKAYAFSGIMTGGGGIQLSRPDAGFRSFAGFEIGSATGCMGVAFKVVDTNALRFAKGIGSFRVLRVGEAGTSPAAPFELVDSDGRPITLTFGDNGDREVRSEIGGSGGIQLMSASSSQNITFKTNQLYTGATVALVGNVHFGDGILASGLPLNTSEYQVYTNASLYFKPTNNLVVPQKVSGFGAWVRAQNDNRVVTFDDVRLTNGTLYAGTSTSANKVITRGGSATNTTFRADYAATNRIEGGRWFGPVFSSQPSAAFELAGGWSTNAMQAGNGSQMFISGGEHWFMANNAYGLGANNQIVRQTGGISGFYAPQGNNNTNAVFVYLSGGTMYNWNADHTRGLGIEISNDAQFIMLPSLQGMRIASDGRSHTFTVRDRGYAEMHALQPMSGGNTSATNFARLNLDGGVLAIRSGFSLDGANISNQTFVAFNGGVFRVMPVCPGLNFPNSAFIDYSVYAGGAKFDLGSDATTALSGPLNKGTAAGVPDGGLQVTGLGSLAVQNTIYADGPVVFGNGAGIVRNLTTSPFVATTDMTLSGSILQLVGSGGDSSALTMDLMPSGGSLKVGPGGTRFQLERYGRASLTLTVPEIVRLNGGLYPISAKSGAANLGTLELLKSTVAPTVTDGIVLASAVYGTDESYRPFSFVGYDAVKGFVPVTTYSDTVKRISTSATVSDAALTGLRVDAATATLSGTATIKSLILNNTSSTRAVVTGGALSIPDEMFVWFNTVTSTSDDYNFVYRGARIESPLQGSGTLQLAASEKNGGTGGPYLEFVPASPDFGGTVRIHSGRVEAANNGAFGTGTVEVHGNAACGGTFLNTRANAVYTNAFKLSGMGWGGSYGAVTTLRDVSFDGPVELIGDARVQSLRYAAAVNFNSVVSGAGRLETFAFAGRIVLKKPSTYQGGTLISGGTLEVSGEGTLGAGDVVNNGVLIFSVSSDTVVTNDIGGTGAIWIGGPGKVTFTGKVTCSGGVQPLASGTGSASGAVSSLGGAGTVDAADGTVANVLSGTGSVVVASGTITANGGSFGGVVSGSGGLTKMGLKPLTLYGQNTYSGATLIGEGTLRLAGAAELFTTGLQYRLDAQNAQSLTVDGNGRVTQWNTQTSTVVFAQADATYSPVYKADGLNGLPSLSFAGKTNRMYAVASVPCRTVFLVNKPDWSSSQNLAGIWGRKDGDGGIRRDSTSAAWQFPGDSNSFASWQCYVNGVATASVASGTPHVLSVVSSSAQTWSTAIGNYWAAAEGLSRSYAGEIGEVLVYGTELYPGDRAQVEQYLINRWNLPGAKAAVTENVLPAGTALTISDFGTLDLNGINQSVGSLAGGGSIINSGTAAILTVGSDNTDTIFTGSFGSNITLVKTGTGTLRLTAPLPAGMTVKALDGVLVLPVDNAIAELEASGTVDLDGRTLTVAQLGGSGQIIDGALRVTDSVTPAATGDFATLTVPADTQLAGTFTVRIGPNAAADCVQSAGTLDLSLLSLVVVKQGVLNSPAHTVVEASAVSGTFSAVDLPGGAGVRYAATHTDVTFAIGTRLILR